MISHLVLWRPSLHDILRKVLMAYSNQIGQTRSVLQFIPTLTEKMLKSKLDGVRFGGW